MCKIEDGMAGLVCSANKNAAKAGYKMQQGDATKDSGIAVVTSLTRKRKEKLIPNQTE